MSKESTRYIITTFVTLALVITVTVSQAWTSPTLPPTGGNVTAPLTTGNTAQFKTGPIGINTGAVPGPGFGLRVGGNVAVTGKLYSASTVPADPVNTLVTKDYLDASLLAGGGGLGVGQSWQYPGRGLGISYANGTSKPIMVNILGSGAGFGLAVHGIACYVNGVQVGFGYSNHSFGDWVGNWYTISFVVPSGANYQCNVINAGALSLWSELR